MYVVDRQLLARIADQKWCIILAVVGLVATILLCHTGGLNAYWRYRLPLVLYPSVAAQVVLVLVSRRARLARACLMASLSLWFVQLFIAMLALMENGYTFGAS